MSSSLATTGVGPRGQQGGKQRQLDATGLKREGGGAAQQRIRKNEVYLAGRNGALAAHSRQAGVSPCNEIVSSHSLSLG